MTSSAHRAMEASRDLPRVQTRRPQRSAIMAQRHGGSCRQVGEKLLQRPKAAIAVGDHAVGRTFTSKGATCFAKTGSRQAQDRQERRRKWNSRSRSDVMMMSRLLGKAGPGQTGPISHRGCWGSGAKHSPIPPLLPLLSNFELLGERTNWDKHFLPQFLLWKIFFLHLSGPPRLRWQPRTRNPILAWDGEYRPGSMGA